MTKTNGAKAIFRSTLFLTCAIVATMVATSCASERPAEFREPAENVFEGALTPEIASMTTSVGAPSAIVMPAWIADDLGLWDAYGLDVELSNIASNQVIPMFLAGEIQFGTLGGYTALPLQDAGVDIDLYGWYFNRSPYTLFGSDDIGSVQDLKGKVIGISQPGGLPHSAAVTFLEANGIDPSSVTFQPLGSVANIFPALAAGRIDAGVFGAPYTLQAAESSSVHPLADLKQAETATPGMAYMGNAEWVAANPNSAKAFLMGWFEAEAIAFSDPDYAKSILAKRLELDPVGDAAIIDASYEETLSVIIPPGPSASGTSAEVANAMVQAMTLSGSQPKTAVGGLEPKMDLLAELDRDGFFDYLGNKYPTIREAA